MAKRTFRFQFVIECASDGRADIERVEEMIDISMQDLIFDDEFTAALDEREAVTIQVTKL